MLMKLTRRLLATLIVAFASSFIPVLQAAETAKQPDLLVFAASSLTNALDEIGAAYTKQSGQPVKFSYAASSALARQIESSARADAFFSADTEWMDYLETRSLIDKASRRDVLGNRLVLVAPAASAIQLKIGPNFPLAASLGNGRLATGDPDSVPVGKYAKGALTSLGVWNDVADRLVRAENVRAALAFIARGEVPLGIVYQTDAQVEKKVRIVDVFPESSHLPITYPVAATRSAQPGTAAFIAFLADPAAVALFKKYGFTVLK
jgi:molybdate transport system substrate-binding protein